MTIVVDASVMVAALVDTGAVGRWAESALGDDPVMAPHLMLVEAANILRRAELAGHVSSDAAALAHADLLAWPVSLFPYSPFAARVWDLRANLTTNDGWYVALAEHLDVPLVTLDHRMAAAPGSQCTFVTPPSSSGR